jgi:acyl-CoA synthetase (AMP-forming)/AMP-acid ligase II
MELLTEALTRHAGSAYSDKEALIELSTSGDISRKITFRQLYHSALALAYCFIRENYPSKRALLFYDMGIECVVAFLGCLYAGVIPIPVYFPRRSKHMERLLSIINNAEAQLGLTIQSEQHRLLTLSASLREFEQVDILATDNIMSHLFNSTPPSIISGGQMAFLQYTSGSTSQPKGIQIQHHALAYNLNMLKQAYGTQLESTFATWVPLYHDFGLIVHVLHALYGGCRNILLSPLHFIQKPYRWLKAISDYRVNISGGPNFAYNLCVTKITPLEMQDLQLNSWQVAANAAEPVRDSTLKNFTDKFKVCGFNEQAWQPSYGLEEATVFVSSKKVLDTIRTISVDKYKLANKTIELTDGEGAVRLVSCGHAWMEEEILIVDPDNCQRCAPHQVGEIWVKGQNVAMGFWNNPQETQRVFNAYINNGEYGPCLRTGDLGFIYDQELYICGRIKDLIIIKGVNYYPQDIEYLVENSHEELVPAANAAFSIFQDEEECLIIMSELNRRCRFYEPQLLQKIQNEIKHNVKKSVLESYDLVVKDVVLLTQGTIPKTSSGKIQRKECISIYLNKKYHEFTRLMAHVGD